MWFGIIFGLFMVLISPILKRWMHGAANGAALFSL